MSGKRLTQSERRIVSGNRRYAKRIAETEKETFGYTVEGVKSFRAVARMAR